MKIYRSLLLVILGFASIAYGQSGTKAVAVVNGQAITQEELMQAASADLLKFESNRPQNESDYDREKLQLMSKTLDSLIDARLVAAEAAKMNITGEDLLDIEVYSNVDVPSPSEVEDFYQANKDSIPLPREQALPQVQKYMVEMSARGYREAFIRRLKKTYTVESYLDPVRTEVASAGHPSRGAADAPVTIVEFSDFECPYCGALVPTLKAIENNYAGKVRIVYRQFPLRMHSHAQKAAEASLCAADQDRFWEFHDSMFSRQNDLTVDALKRRAVELNLDTDQFNACLDSGKQVSAIKKDVADGGEAGVNGTPAMFINGRLLSGNQPYAEIRDIIEDELSRVAAR